MERPENIENITLFPFPDDYGSIYDFFCECERSSTVVTIPMIRDKFFRGNYDAAYAQVQNYWRWFLVRIDSKSQTHKYLVEDLIGYPRFYFVEANKPHMMRYFHHFVQAKKAYDARERVLRTRKTASAYRNLTLDEMDKQLNNQQPMPDIIIHMDDDIEEIEDERPANEDDIDITEEIEADEPQVLGKEAIPPIIADPLGTPRQPPSSSHLVTWIILGSIAILIVVGVIYLLFNRRE